MGKISVDLALDSVGALDLLRLHAYRAGRSVDDVAADLLAGEFRPADLQPVD
jgi:hypothetical protein